MSKLLSTVFLFSTLFFLTACPPDSPGVYSGKSVYDGRWVIHCDTHGSNLSPSKEELSLIDRKMTHTTEVFAVDDVNCNNPTIRIDSTYLIDMSAPSYIQPYSTFYDINIQRVNIYQTLYSQAQVDSRNTGADDCHTGWEVGVPKEVSLCADFVEVIAGKINYNIIAVDTDSDPNRLLFGDLDSGDAMSEENRPSKLDEDYFFTRKVYANGAIPDVN